MYSSLDRVDSAIKEAGGAIVAQVLTDHRAWAEIEAEPEISVLFALTRVLSARAFAKQNGFGTQVNYIVVGDIPVFLRMALAAANTVLTNLTTAQRVHLPQVTTSPGELADAAFQALARRVQNRVGSSDAAAVLQSLEVETLASPPDKERDEISYWTRVVELAAVFGELLRARTGGHWIASSHPHFDLERQRSTASPSVAPSAHVEYAEQAAIPFGFVSEDELVTFPTNRAQRLLAGDTDASLFQLFQLAETRSAHVTQFAILPSLRSRTEAARDSLKFRPLLPYTPATHDAPVIAYGSDANETFGLLTTNDPRSIDRLDAEALANLADHAVQLEPLPGGSILAITDSFFATEKLLDREFMRSLHVRLGSATLAVGVPRRGLLLVRPLHSDDPHEADELATRIREEYAAGDQISSLLLVVRDGIVSAPQVATPPGEPTPAPPQKPGRLRRLFGRS